VEKNNMEIITYGNNILRNKSKRVDNIDNNIEELIDNMIATMNQIQGVGLAAPQVGENLRIFVINVGDGNIRKVINPEFLEISKEIEQNEEGCLSIPGIYKKVERAKKIKIRYQNEKGNEVIEEAEDLLARAFQHEYDHLEGILFIDKVSPISKKLISNKLKKIKRETIKSLN
jgi:peptide deformylase